MLIRIILKVFGAISYLDLGETSSSTELVHWNHEICLFKDTILSSSVRYSWYNSKQGYHFPLLICCLLKSECIEFSSNWYDSFLQIVHDFYVYWGIYIYMRIISFPSKALRLLNTAVETNGKQVKLSPGLLMLDVWGITLSCLSSYVNVQSPIMYFKYIPWSSIINCILD